MAATNGYQPKALKMRNTCDQCADAKVACPREKPVCTRCADRGLPCKYSVTKRVGRTSQKFNRQAVSSSDASVSTSAPSTIAAQDNNIDNSNQQAPLSPLSPLRPGNGSTVNGATTASLFTPAIPSPAIQEPSDAWLSQLSASSSADFQDLLASAAFSPPRTFSDCDTTTQSPFDFSLDDFIDHNASTSYPNSNDPNTTINPNNNNSNHTSGHLHETSINSSISSSYGDNGGSSRNSIALFPGSSQVSLTPSPRSSVPPNRSSTISIRSSIEGILPSSVSEPLSFGQSLHSDSSCRCLLRALNFLPGMSPNTSEASSLTNNDPSQSQTSSFELVLSQNEQAVEAIRNMLRCQCSKNSYILVILPLAVFSILNRYATLLCATNKQYPGQDAAYPPEWQSMILHKPTSRSLSTGLDYDFDDEGQQRIAGQLILSKLYGVQQLVNMLSLRLQNIEHKVYGEGVMLSKQDHDHGAARSLLEGDALLRPFSAKLTQTLEADMRKSLRQVSQVIIEKLRRA